jgi:hypothetical protein
MASSVCAQAGSAQGALNPKLASSTTSLTIVISGFTCGRFSIALWQTTFKSAAAFKQGTHLGRLSRCDLYGIRGFRSDLSGILEKII